MVDCLPVGAQVPDFLFRHLTINDGLSANGLRNLFQDSKGFLWVSSIDGLNRYDGQQVTTFHHQTGDSLSLPVNFTLSVAEDSAGDIWIGCGGSFVARYNYESNVFTNYNLKKKSDGNVSRAGDNCKVISSNGNTWVLNNNKLFHFNFLTHQFEEFKLKESIFKLHNQQNSWLYISDDKKIYCRTDGDLCVMNADGSALKSYFTDSVSASFFNNCYISVLKVESNGDLWFSDWIDFRSYFYSASERKIYPIDLEPEILLSAVVLDFIDYKNYLLAGTYANGIYIIDKATRKSVKHLTHSSLLPASLAENAIHSLLFDAQGTLLVATGNGLDSYNPINHQFNFIQNDDAINAALIVPPITDAYEVSKEHFWFGEYGGGMNEWHKGNATMNFFGSFDDLRTSENKSLISSIHKKDDEHLWVGLQWGVAVFDLKTKTMSDTLHFPGESGILSRHSVIEILEDSTGNTWFCTAQNGLVRFNKIKNEYVLYSNHSKESDKNIPGTQLSFICCDKEGNIWLAVKEFQGLIKIRSGSLEIELLPFSIDKFQTGFSGFINSIAPDGDSLLWLGTWNYGLLKFNVSTKKFISFSAKEGLCNSSVNGITTDSKNNLWIATQNGLASFNKKTQQFRNYFTENGLPQNLLDDLIFTSGNGNIYMGIKNGVIEFNPDSIIFNSSPPRTFITAMLVNGDRYLWSRTEKKNSFTSDKKNFSFEFSGINFIDPEHNHYAFRLVGYQSDWTFCGNRQFANFTNLTGGDYVFEVKAANNEGVWESTPFSISFHIDTPFYARWWFYLASILCVTSVLYFLYRIRINRLIAIEKIRTNISRDLHDDVGSALSSINIWSSMVNTEKSGNEKKSDEYLSRIRTSSQNMLDSMNDIIWAINPMNDTIEKILVRMKLYASEILEPKNIKFDFEVADELKKIEIPMQYRRELYLIFKEAINNSVKYSGATSIAVRLLFNNRLLIFSISDNGKGFENEKQSMGNGLRNMSERAKKMNAQFQLTTSPGNGTAIMLKLKFT